MESNINISIDNNLVNKLNNNDKERVIFNFFNKLKLLDIQSKIYQEKFSNEININLISIDMVNKFFKQFNDSLESFQKEIIESIQSVHINNLTNQQELLNDSCFIDQLISKYPEYSIYLKTTSINQDFDSSNETSCDTPMVIPGSAGFAPITISDEAKKDVKNNDPIDTKTATARNDPLFPTGVFINDTNKLLELIVDDGSIDGFINSNTKRTVISSSLHLNQQMINLAQDSIEKIFFYRKNIDIINYTNYFIGNEKQITNTQTLNELLENILSSHIDNEISSNVASATSSNNRSSSEDEIEYHDLSSSGSSISSNNNFNSTSENIVSSSEKKKKKSPGSHIPTPRINYEILDKSAALDKKLKPNRDLTYAINGIDSISVHDDHYQYGIIRSFPIERFYEYLEGFCPMYVAQLSHYYINKEIDRNTMLKFLNMLFDDSFSSANYYTQKIESITLSSSSPNISPRNHSANTHSPLESSLNPISKVHLKIKLPYLETLEVLIGQIYAYNSHLKYYKRMGYLSEIRKGFGLDVKGGMFFDECIDIRTRRILQDISNINTIEISTDFRCTSRYYQYSYSIGNNQTFLDFNNRGIVPYCYKLAYEYNNYMFGRYSNEAAVAGTLEKYRIIYANFIENVIQSNIHIKIGKLELSIYAGELTFHKHLLNYSIGEFYRSMNRSINFTSKLEQKTHSLFCFLITPIFYFIYYFPHRFSNPHTKYKYKYNNINYNYNKYNNNNNSNNHNINNINYNNNYNNMDIDINYNNSI